MSDWSSICLSSMRIQAWVAQSLEQRLGLYVHDINILTPAEMIILTNILSYYGWSVRAVDYCSTLEAASRYQYIWLIGYKDILPNFLCAKKVQHSTLSLNELLIQPQLKKIFYQQFS